MAGNAELADTMLRQQVLVQRLASGEAGKFERFLREIDRELRARLAGDDLTTFERARLERLIEGVDDMLRGVLDRFTRQLVLDLQDFAVHEAGVTARAIGQPNIARILYRGTTGSAERITGGIGEGYLFAAADEATAKLYGSTIEKIAVRAEARVLVEGTAEFAKVAGRRRGKLLDTLRPGENLKTAADAAVRAARAAGYDAVEFTSMKDMGIAILKEDAVIRAYGAAPKAVTTALASNADFEAVIPAVAQVRAAVLTNPLAVKGPDGGSLLEPFLRNWTAAERRAVTGAIRLGVFEGKTNQQLVQVLRGTRAANYTDGLLATTARHAEAVVRTAVQHVSSAARAETMRVNADIVDKVRWLSTLDKRTCPRCGALDGKEFKVDKGPRPPLHPNCRCTVVPVLADEFAGLDEGMRRPAKGASGPRQVDAELSYYEWLKRQPAAFQNAAIGKSRAKLLRDGGLSAQRFAALQMDKRFLPLTLDEMRALEPLAFQRAGL